MCMCSLGCCCARTPILHSLGLRNISEGWEISQRVVESFRGFWECFGGFYKAERGLKNFEGAWGEKEKAQRGWEGKQSEGM